MEWVSIRCSCSLCVPHIVQLILLEKFTYLFFLIFHLDQTTNISTRKTKSCMCLTLALCFISRAFAWLKVRRSLETPLWSHAYTDEISRSNKINGRCFIWCVFRSCATDSIIYVSKLLLVNREKEEKKKYVRATKENENTELFHLHSLRVDTITPTSQELDARTIQLKSYLWKMVKVFIEWAILRHKYATSVLAFRNSDESVRTSHKRSIHNT